MGFFSDIFKSKEKREKLKKGELGLKKSAYSFSRLEELLKQKRKVDESFYKELEEILILADCGIEYTSLYLSELKARVKKAHTSSTDELKELCVDLFKDLYKVKEASPSLSKLKVYLFVGVNGSGKTTTVGKLAYKLSLEGHKVILASGDTFRAGANEQLSVWAKRANCSIVSKEDSSDPASVCFDALKKAKEEDADYLLIDTAGRLQNKVNLMKELEKLYRIIKREVPDAPQEALLVIDATTGQNGLSQAKLFNESAPLTGVVLTKLDGTGKGGIVLSINNVLSLPIKMYGCGETATDLKEFSIDEYIYTLFKELFE